MPNMRLRKIILSLLLTLTLTPTVVSYAKKGSKKKTTNRQARYNKALSDLNSSVAQLDALLGTNTAGEKRKKAQKPSSVDTEKGSDQLSKSAMK